MIISLIAAVSKNNVIGIENQLPWHLPADLQYFKNLTVNHPILMGRKTFTSIGRPLPKRENIVITKDISLVINGLVIKHSIEDAIAYCQEKHYKEIFIIGGETVYRQTINMSHKLYLTRVDTIIENGTAFFPAFNLSEWKLISSDMRKMDMNNALDFTFEVYEKIV